MSVINQIKFNSVVYDIAAQSADKLSTNAAGSATQPVYFSEGKPVACTYTLGKSVPSNAVFTDTVYTHPNSGISAGTYRSVTVNAQGHVTGGSNPTTLAGYGITDAAAANHTHSNYLTGITKSMVTTALGYTPPTSDTNTWRPIGTTADTACAGNDSRLSNARPASDVYAWAKASTKPTYTYSEVGAAAASHSHNYLTCVYGGNQTSCYFKFSDGTLICSKRVGLDTTFTAAWGSLFETPSFSLGNWAYTFVAEPHVSLTSYSHASSAEVNKNHSFVEGCKNVSTTSAGSTFLARAEKTTATRTYWVSVIGIGRWA